MEGTVSLDASNWEFGTTRSRFWEPMAYETTMDMDWSDWEYNCARSWEAHILQMQEAAYLSLQDEEHPPYL